MARDLNEVMLYSDKVRGPGGLRHGTSLARFVSKWSGSVRLLDLLRLEQSSGCKRSSQGFSRSPGPWIAVHQR